MPPRGLCKNKNQDSIMMEFMIANPDVAKGFSKGDRFVIAEKWDKLHNDLNSAGPPTKALHAWKKIWTNRLTAIRTKLAKNPIGENLSTSEKEVATICDLFIARQGVLRSRRIKKEPEALVKKMPLDRNTSVKMEPPVENEILPNDDKENQWEDMDDCQLASAGSSSPVPETSGPMSAMLKILQTMNAQQREHFKEMKAIKQKKLELTKTISQNIAKMVNND